MISITIESQLPTPVTVAQAYKKSQKTQIASFLRGDSFLVLFAVISNCKFLLLRAFS